MCLSCALLKMMVMARMHLCSRKLPILKLSMLLDLATLLKSSPPLLCCTDEAFYRRATGSKFDTKVMAATMTTKMTPPAVTLKSRFFRDGVTAASAAIGLASMAAVEVLMIAEAISVLEACCFCCELQQKTRSQLAALASKTKASAVAPGGEPGCSCSTRIAYLATVCLCTRQETRPDLRATANSTTLTQHCTSQTSPDPL